MFHKVTPHKVVFNWLFIAFIAAFLPAITLLGHQTYLMVSELIKVSNLISQEGEIQELEHRIRSEQGRKCIIDELDALVKDVPYLKPSECEAPDLFDLMEDLERAKESLNS